MVLPKLKAEAEYLNFRDHVRGDSSLPGHHRGAFCVWGADARLRRFSGNTLDGFFFFFSRPCCRIHLSLSTNITNDRSWRDKVFKLLFLHLEDLCSSNALPEIMHTVRKNSFFFASVTNERLSTQSRTRFQRRTRVPSPKAVHIYWSIIYTALSDGVSLRTSPPPSAAVKEIKTSAAERHKRGGSGPREGASVEINVLFFCQLTLKTNLLDLKRPARSPRKDGSSAPSSKTASGNIRNSQSISQNPWLCCFVGHIIVFHSQKDVQNPRVSPLWYRLSLAAVAPLSPLLDAHDALAHKFHCCLYTLPVWSLLWDFLWTTSWAIMGDTSCCLPSLFSKMTRAAVQQLHSL